MAASQPIEVTCFSHRSVEYFTPAVYIEAAREVMGGIDLDPASCEEAQETVRATDYFELPDSGLEFDWYVGSDWDEDYKRPRSVFMNPPYSKTGSSSNQAIWATKLQAEYDAGHVSEAIMLVKAALGYKWFEQLWRTHWCCFCRERIAFVLPGGGTAGLAKQGSVFVYFGRHPERFAEVFAQFGRVIPPEVKTRCE
jgi:hypothetical protein